MSLYSSLANGTIYQSLSSGVINHNAAYTVMLWVYIATDANDYGHFWSADTVADAYQNADWIGLNLDGTTLRIGSYSGGSGSDGLGTNLSVGTWYHVALVRSSTTALIGYLNGASDTTTVTTNVSARAAAVDERIGRLNGGFGVIGRYAHFKQWSVALTAAEIAAEMRSIRPVRFADLNRWTPMIASEVGNASNSLVGSSWTQTGTWSVESGPAVSWGAPVILSLLAASGGVSGTIAVTLASFAPSLTGTTTVTGSVANTLSAFVSSITGTTTVHGSIASTLNAFASSIQGTTTVNGAIANTLDPFTSSISGTAGSATGAISALLGSFTANIVGRHDVVMRRDSGGGKRRKSKKSFLIQDDLYEQRIKASVETPDSIHPPVKPKAAKPVPKPAITIGDMRPAISQIVTDEDVELVLMVLDALDEAA